MTVRVGIVGAGFMGQIHARSLAGVDGARLTAVIELNSELGTAVADEFGATSYADIDSALAADAADAYILVLPDKLHRDATIQLLEAGKAVLVEKPMAHTLPDAKAMASAERHGGRMMVGQILRFDPRYIEAATTVAQGGIGEPLHGSSGRYTNSAQGERLDERSSPAFYQGIHDVDALQWISGQQVTRVYARAVSKLLRSKGLKSDDAYFATCEMTNGMIGQLYCGWSLPAGVPTNIWARTEIIGTEGLIDLDVRDNGLRILSSASWSLRDVMHWPTANGRIMGDLYEEQRHFIEALRKDLEFAVPTSEALRAVAVNDAILKSAQSGQPEDVADWSI
ncbi:MAG: Gfo/Idh/MocA family protein [Beutenbergiaceae bacterium]